MKTLEEHKADTAAEEAKKLDASPQEEEEELESEAPEAEEEAEQESPEVAATDDDSDDEPKAKEQEAWMQEDDNDPQSDEVQSNDTVWAEARRTMQGKLERKTEKLNDAHKEEMDKIRAEMAELRSGNQPQQPTSTRPKRDDFYDRDEEYDDAMYAWRTQKDAASVTNAANKRLREEQISAQSAALDNHYSQAEKLCRDSDISAKAFQQSDHKVKEALGENIANILIAQMGEGSGKVFFNIGRNPGKLAQLKQCMQDDPNGLKAMMFLGETKTSLTLQKRKSLAPKPANTVKGNAPTNRSAKASQKAYEKAHAKGDTAEAWRIKQEAKASGESTRNWT